MILVQDLALIMASAAVAAVICQRLKQPVVLGYILVGGGLVDVFGWAAF